MNTQLAAVQEESVTENYKRAVELHRQIMINGELAYNYLVEFCKHLKAMRDEKLYTELGHSTFDDYVEKRTGMKSRQAYKYISTYEGLGSTVLQSNARLGITKLELLTSVSDTERATFVEDNDLEGMSVKEIKALIEQSKQQQEQISLLTTTVENQKADLDQVQLEEQSKEQLQEDLDWFAAEKERLERELNELKSKPIDVAVAEPSKADIEKIKAEAEAKFEKEKKQAIKEAAEKATEKAKKDIEKQLEQVKSETTEKVKTELANQLSELEKEKSDLLAKAEKQAKALHLKGDSEIVKFSVYFNSLQDIMNKICEEIKSTEKEKALQLSNAVKKYLDQYAIPMLEEV